jgi:hypothetical protein
MTVADAYDFARQAHEGQVDKLGEPYINHIARVMRRLDDPDAKMVAALHDVVEDTPTSLEDLRSEGFPSRVVDAVEAMTKRETEAYTAFIERLSGNPLARAVKVADLYDNSDEARLARLPAEVARRLRAKYDDAIDRLGARELIAQWRRHDQLAAATTDLVLAPTSEGLEKLAAEATVDVSFECNSCGATAARLTLLGHTLVRSGFLGVASFDVPSGSLEAVSTWVREGDFGSLMSVDSEYVPFWCRQCEQAWCQEHWSAEVSFDDGFYDATYGVCPAGHRQKLDD